VPVWANDDRLRRIESVTDAALAALDVEDLLVELLDRVREVLGVDTAAVLLLDSPGQQLVATAARGIEEEVRQGVRIPLGKGFAGRIAAESKPVIVESVDHSTVLNPILRARGIRSLLGVPLLSGGKVIGVLHVGSLTSRRFTADEVGLLQVVADRVALAVQARLSQVERAAAGALQRSLLPARLPAVPGLDLAARYVAGEEGRVGGDWYDVFALPSGRLWLVIGDVAGHGLSAAVVMGRLRTALRAYTLDDGSPGDVLGRMDSNVQQFEPEAMATVFCATFEPSLDRLQVSSAGHLAPVLALPGQPAVMLDVPIDPPLGVRGRLRRRTTTIPVPPDALLLLYTDGLVERRAASLESGLERLRAATIVAPAESVVMALFATLVGNEVLSDDIAMLAVRRVGGTVAPAETVRGTELPVDGGDVVGTRPTV
jgi:putative methionine-R-sulfoxide reductase with GAF domain